MIEKYKWKNQRRKRKYSGPSRHHIIPESRGGTSQLENISEEEFDDFGYEIEVEVDDTKRFVENKITSLQSLIDYLERIVELEEEEDLVKYFSDIKQINL